MKRSASLRSTFIPSSLILHPSSLSDLPHIIHAPPHRLILIADHIRIRFELALRVHKDRQLGGRVYIGALDEAIAQIWIDRRHLFPQIGITQEISAFFNEL